MTGMDENGGQSTPVLGDMTLEEPSYQPKPKGVDDRLAGASTPLLADMNDMGATAPAPAAPRYQSLSAEQIAILQQQRATQGQPPYTEEEIAELNADYIERQRMQMQQQAFSQASTAGSVMLEEATYTAPEKKKTVDLPQVDAASLLEEPAPEPVRRVSFDQADLEEAKRKATKRAAESLNEAPPTDSKAARKQLEALRQQQLADLAQAGFPLSIVLTVIGVLAGICMVIFASSPFPEDVEVSGFFGIATNVYRIAGFALIALAITIVLRVQACKGFSSFLYAVSAILLVIPGIVVLLQKKATGTFPLACVCFVLAVVGCFVVTFVLSTSDKLNAYYARKDIMID